MPEILVPLKVLAHGEGLEMPAYATAGSAGCDLRAAIEAPLLILPGGRALVPTGVAVAIPEGYEGQVRIRSGLAHDKGLAVVNAPGTIDSDYRGEIRVIVANLGSELVTLERGERIAQLVFAPVEGSGPQDGSRCLTPAFPWHPKPDTCYPSLPCASASSRPAPAATRVSSSRGARGCWWTPDSRRASSSGA